MDDYVYMLLSAAGLESATLSFDSKVANQLEEKQKIFEQMDPSFMKVEEYQNYVDTLKEAVALIQENTDRFFTLQEVVNSLYCLLLNQPYASEEVIKEIENIVPIIKEVADAVSSQSMDSIPDEIVALFEHTEGKLEHYVNHLSKDESILHSCEESFQAVMEAMMLQSQFECLQYSSLLCSNSAFIELHNKKNTIKADRKYIEAAFDSMAQQMNEVLSSQNKWYHRAVIAAVLREMPVLFGSVDEVKDYIMNSLSGCKDVAEKAASVELFMSAVAE